MTMFTAIKVFTLILILIIIPSCKNGNNRISRSNVLIIKKNGLIYEQKSNKPYSGVIKDTINDKVMEYNVKEGLKDGPFKVSRVSGEVEMEGSMKKDKNEGEWKYYYANGQVESIGNFVNDTPSGKWIFYYKSGIVKEQGDYKNGKRDGKWIEYDSTGKAVSHINFVKGDTVK